MDKTRRNRRVKCGFTLVILGICLVFSWRALAGVLNPPSGPIGSTMHSLDEVYTAITNNGRCVTPQNIRSFYAEGTGPSTEPLTLTLAQSVPGPNGFIITDIVCASLSSGSSGTSVPFKVIQNGVPVARVFTPRLAGGSEFETFSYHFQSGIPILAGSTLQVQRVEGDNFAAVTVSG